MIALQALRAASIVRASAGGAAQRVVAASSTLSPVAPAAESGPGAVRGLSPAPVFEFFAQLSQIPRASTKEQEVIEWLRSFAAARQLKVAQDTKGNLVVYKKGQAGGEAAPPVILQGHVDMVCEANGDSAHNFDTDPIKLVVESGFLKAAGTTLGADNGIGVATILAVLDLPPTEPCPPIEALFTVEEEIGLLGAAALDGSLLIGKTLLNLDSEDWGVIYIGSAGAGESALTLRLDLEPRQADGADDGLVPYTLSLGGLAGGHSGLAIHHGLGNAVQLLAGATVAVLAAAPGARLVDLRGGDKRNAIPREAAAELLLPEAQLPAARAAAALQQAQMREVYGSKEPSLALELLPTPPLIKASAPGVGAAAAAETEVLSREGAAALLALLTALPTGVIRMSPVLPGLVETSTNLASVKLVSRKGGVAVYRIINMTRSSLPAALAAERARIAAIGRMAGALVEQPPDYRGWAPNPRSALLDLTRGVLRRVCGREPEVTAIHAGLECGVLGGALGGDVDMVSFGPNIFGAHSPAERLEVATMEPFWEATRALLGELAKRR